MNDIVSIIQTLGIAGIVVSGTVWLIKKVSEQLLSRDLEKFKSDLETDAFQFKTRFEKLHAERAEVIRNLYQKIIDAEQNLNSLIHPFQPAGQPSQDEKAKLTVESINSLISYFEQNKIFLDEKTERVVEKVVHICRTAWQDFDMVLMMQKSQDREYLKKWSELWKRFTDESPTAKKRITKKFRQILGIEI